NQDDDGGPGQDQSHGETEPRQGAASCYAAAHYAPCARPRSVLVDLVENAALGEVFLLRLGPAAKHLIDREQFDLGEGFFVLLRDLAIARTIGVACGNF